MSSPRVLLVELETALAVQLTEELTGLGVEVTVTKAPDAVKQLLDAPPDLAIVNLELSQGSGFGFVNRVLRMEALAGLAVVLVVNPAVTEAAIDAHRQGPTPADDYVKPVVDDVLEVAQRLLTDPIPEVADGELTEVAAAAAADADAAAGAANGNKGPPREISERLHKPERRERDRQERLEKRDKREKFEKREKREDPLERTIRELGYRVLRRLPDEDGGAGAVFACRDDELQRAVAIKLMPPEGIAGGARDERMQRFDRERRILALLRSPYVLSVYGAGTHRGTPYLVRELIDGESLAERIKHQGALDVITAVRYARETALGLAHAASVGVIHRDVGPHNIHVVDEHAKIARFGMGKRENDAKITRAGVQLMADMTYIAPERVRGQEDARGDIYALGVTLHTLVAGRSPFATAACVDMITGKRTERPAALEDAKPGTPPLLALLVKRLIDEDPARRPQTWDEVIAELDEVARALAPDTPARGAVTATPATSEPSAVHGTLRLMSVVEIVQSLELSRKTATVFLPSADESEGKLAFESGRLVHASLGIGKRGNDAFFALVARTSGAFRVEYEPLASALEKNIDMPVAGLLLEAARRTDEAAKASSSASPAQAQEQREHAASPKPTPATPPPRPATSTPAPAKQSSDERAMAAAISQAVDSAFFEQTGERAPAAAPRERAQPQPPPASAPQRRREIGTVTGLLFIAAAGAGIVVGVRELRVAPLIAWSPWEEPGDVDEPAARAAAELLAKTRKELRETRAALAAVEPKLAELEKQQATASSAQQAARDRAKAVHASLEKLVQELADRRIALGMSQDGAEVVIEIGELALFNADGDEVSGDGKPMLAKLAKALVPLDDVDVRVEGHTDDSEPTGRARHRNNWGLSGARATSVAKALTSEGLASKRVGAAALAETKPVASNKGAKGRARNRRIELHLVPRVADGAR